MFCRKCGSEHHYINDIRPTDQEQKRPRALDTMCMNNEGATIRTTASDVANLLLGMALFATLLILFLNLPQDELIANISSCIVLGQNLFSAAVGDVASTICGMFGVLEVSALAYTLIVIAKSILCLTHSIEDRALEIVGCFQNILFWVSGIIASCILMIAVLCFLSSASQNIPALATADESTAELVDSICSFCAIVAMLVSFVADIVITATGLTSRGESQITEAAENLNRIQPLLWIVFITSPAILSLVFGFICAVLIGVVVAILNAVFMLLLVGVIATTVFVIFICELFRF